MGIDPWKITSNQIEKEDRRLQESLTSIGNGYMGMRGNFSETYSGDSHQGTYIAGVWFPDRPSSNLSTCLHPYDLAVLHDATYQVFIENLTLSLLSVTQINYRGTAIMILLNSCYELSIDHIIQKFQATKQVVFLCTMYQFYSCMNLLFYVSKFKIIFLIIRISSG